MAELREIVEDIIEKSGRNTPIVEGDTILPDTSEEIIAGSGIGTEINPDDYYTKTEVNTIVSGVNDTIRDDYTAMTQTIASLSGSVQTITGRTIPTKVSELQNDTGYITTAATTNFLTGYTETDPTVPSWAKAANKPSYTASEVGALPTGTTLDNVPDGSTRKLSNYVAKDGSKVLSTNDYTTAEKNKLAGIASGAQVNVIETIKVNNTALTPSSKAVSITVPTTTSQLTNNSNYVTTADTKDYITSAQAKTQIEAYGYTTNIGTITGVNMNGSSKGTSGSVNLGTVVTAITVNGTAATITNGAAASTIAIPEGLPSVSSSDNGKVLRVVNGTWSAQAPITLRTGTGTPAASLGNVGDIYIQTT